MDLYNQFEALRDIISEDDQAVCGLSSGRRDEAMRRNAMSTMTATNLAEDDTRSDSETMFFFNSESAARMCYAKAVNLGLAPGEVMFDSGVSEEYGVGKFCVRFAPHVKTTKKEVMFALWRSGVGDASATPRMYESWMEATNGALMVSEDAFSQATQASGVNHPYGFDAMSSDPVQSLTGKPSRDPGSDPTQSLSQPMDTGRIDAFHTETKTPANDALRVFQAAEQGHSDYVHDGTNGTPINGGAASTHYKLAPGADRASPRMEADTLSEELMQVAGMSSLADLKALME